ncbi:YgaP family membrane protein [Reinekea marinisedimentorum]|uniref:Inner membrane protein YgaP-like transmembrane domain-containing protein n=1 Tax=Reinekea marinisedimentorum TaxID=230495 RepID=A0A4R3IDQ2_9GAMM|nr:DUF2892 domain-containing protein [Reinekea marinisedimentorum]TCS43906.1 Protein of unknown function (DUF2892) [Reinekea marinisedimentorum]
MKVNMGSTDRTARLVVGLLFLLAVVMGWVSGVLAVVLGVLGVVFIVTAIIRFCPLYLPLGLNTCKRK